MAGITQYSYILKSIPTCCRGGVVINKEMLLWVHIAHKYPHPPLWVCVPSHCPPVPAPTLPWSPSVSCPCHCCCCPLVPIVGVIPLLFHHPSLIWSLPPLYSSPDCPHHCCLPFSPSPSQSPLPFWALYSPPPILNEVQVEFTRIFFGMLTCQIGNSESELVWMESE